jgi:tRNA/tmRNA/rRNA uracil-C5-methylase (TrmA/RlmC/RlmD family)
VSHAAFAHTVVDSRGGPIIEESVGGRTFRVHASAFWQVHREAPAAFVSTVSEFADLSAGESLADLYSGSGLFAGCLAAAVGESGRVVAVESVVDAVRDARRSLSDLPHVELVTADVNRWLAENTEVFDVVVLDPPRAGLGLASVPDVARAARRSLVYVACEPSALARDCAALAGHGWRLTRLRCLDAFPMTSHLECIALFERA